jgi:hypothetical protein
MNLSLIFYLGLNEKKKKTLHVMIWVGLTKNGQTKPYIICKGQTIDSQYYRNSILPYAKKERLTLFETNKLVKKELNKTNKWLILKKI